MVMASQRIRRGRPAEARRTIRSCSVQARIMRDETARRLSSLHTTLYRATNGVVGRRLVDNDMLLLTTTRRQRGGNHTVPLLYLGTPEQLVVFASWGGRPDHPEWYKNLVADPKAVVQVLGRQWPVTARTAAEPERSTWWDRAVAAYDGYAGYQAKTDRQIPVVLLES